MLLSRHLVKRVARLLPKGRSLSRQLRETGRTRWLDLGSSSFEDGFTCLSLVPSAQIPTEKLRDYIEIDFMSADIAVIEQLGQFDLVRSQHMFEHFTFEESEELLRRIAKIMKTDAYLLVTTPDLKLQARAYLQKYRFSYSYRSFAKTRIPEDAPPSFIFSVFAHQYGYTPKACFGEAHKWCYDLEGLQYIINRSGLFDRVEKLGLLDQRAEIPFTHNRPDEDVCVIARRKPHAGTGSGADSAIS